MPERQMGTAGRRMKGLRRISLRPGGPRTSSRAAGRSEWQRRGVRRWLGTGASAEQRCASGTNHLKWQRLSHTGTALPAQRRRVLPARTKRCGRRGGGSTRWNLMLRAVSLSGSLASHGYAFSRQEESISSGRGPPSRPHVRVLLFAMPPHTAFCAAVLCLLLF
ncbi:uncharacterized protein AAGF69_009542 [Amazona ochrocephala]